MLIETRSGRGTAVRHPQRVDALARRSRSRRLQGTGSEVPLIVPDFAEWREMTEK